MNDESIIRFAQPGDIEGIVRLCELHANFEGEEYPSLPGDERSHSELLAELLFESPLAMHCLVVEQENKLVGYATYMKQVSTWAARHYLYLDCLFLTEEARGLGLGYRLIERVRAESRRMGCQQLQWQTPDFNTSAIRFYERLGAQAKAKLRFFWWTATE